MNIIEEQRDYIDKVITENLFSSFINKNINFYECPTGSGKSVIALKSAKLLLNEFDTSVIISTNSNELAISYLKNAKDELLKYRNIKILDDEISLLLGKNNFIDKDVILNLIERKIEGFKEINKENFLIWYDDYSKMKLVDIFLQDFNIDNSLKEVISLSMSDNEILSILNFLVTIKDNNTIFITNHLYLTTLIEYLSKNHKDFDISSIPIILDEAHDFKKLNQLKYTYDFSTFRFKNLINSIKQEKESKKFKEFKNDIQKIFNDTKYFKNLKNDKLEKQHIYLLKDFFEKYKNDFSKILKKIEKDDFNTVLKNHLQKEFFELSNLYYIKDNSKIKMQYSLKKGYLKVTALSKEPKFELRKSFWQNVGNVILLSGTFRVNKEHKTALENSWSLKRLGLFPYKTKDFMEDYEINFNRKLEKNTYFKIFNWIFDKNNFKYCVIEDDELQVVTKYDENFQNKKEDWALNVSKFYFNYYDKYFKNSNTLLLVGSYDDILIINEKLKKLNFSEDKIFYEKRNESQGILLNKYKKVAYNSIGNIIIGTLSFFTGIDLKGQLCENIIMTKLPYSTYDNLEVSQKKDNYTGDTFRADYENEMKLIFRQGIGRGSRNEDDKCVLFILDKRINKPNKRVLFGFLEEMGDKIDFSKNIKEKIGDYK